MRKQTHEATFECPKCGAVWRTSHDLEDPPLCPRHLRGKPTEMRRDDVAYVVDLPWTTIACHTYEAAFQHATGYSIETFKQADGTGFDPDDPEGEDRITVIGPTPHPRRRIDTPGAVEGV